MSGGKRLSRQTWQYDKDIRILGSAVSVGPKEGEGPLADQFDKIHDSLYCGRDSWEKAERQLLEDAIQLALQKSNRVQDEIDVILAGDLLNQTITSNFAASKMQIPFIGMFGACSTSMETLSMAAALVDAGFSRYTMAACSSHNASAERQFRYPTEYGGQKPESAQWTVTGAGGAVVGRGTTGPCITHATIGKVIDMGIKNPFELGPAMAPAAADTLSTHFRDLGRSPQDYDLIVTGDLARIGYKILIDLMNDLDYDIAPVYNDCGIMIYSEDQEVFSGASGCASSAVVTYSHIVNGLNQGKWNRVLVCATGALFSPVSYQQGESIPCIAHAVALERKGDDM
ncbi:MAG: stage V sporulation protein AD [Bacillaceae bacterium]|nr:stage V sporulation protein AD [Bacillaceae bacterium]